MKKLKAFVERYVFSETLSLNARIINMICLIGMLAALITTVFRVFMRSDYIIILVMGGIILSIAFLMYVCNRFHWYVQGIWITLYMLCDVLFPVAFFLLGGVDSGMAAVFVLSIVIIFLLLDGKTLVIFLATHIVLIVGCYLAGYFFPHLVRPINLAFQTGDNILALFVSGFFIGLVILFHERIYLLEKEKVKAAGDRLAWQDKLLRVVNGTANLLLSSDMEEFESLMSRSMEMLARNLEVDQINIWKNSLQEEGLYYHRVYSWSVDTGFSWKDECEEFSYRDGLSRWEELLSSGRCINGPLASMREEERQPFKGCRIVSCLVIPVFLEKVFWGFVSFDDRRRERVFPADEEGILRSGSLLLVNAIVRNEVMQSLVAAREEALSGARAKSEFLSNMSHEIRTPMNAIIGMTSIAKSTGDLNRKNECLDKIGDASTHLLRVINDVLDMSKIEANKLELSHISFNFENMLRRVVDVINVRAAEKRQTLTIFIDPRIPPFLITDDQRLAQVITNLLSNAVKFTPEEGSIRLNARLQEKQGEICTVRIEVVDTGIGINREQRKRLFNSFEQADSNTSRRFGGTGLGLAISKRLVDMMEGTIRIESEPGKGSSFIVTIRAAEDTGRRDNLARRGVGRNNLRVLCVDDDFYIREYFNELSPRLGFTCDTVSEGEEALAVIEKNGPYDIYFVDWKMTGMDGVETARRIKELTEKKPETSIGPVVIMISAGEMDGIEQEARSAGVDKFLSKPLFPSTLMDSINQCLGVENYVPAAGPETTAADVFEGRRILLAEDVEINREIIQALLEPTAVRIDYAENGAEALEMYSASPDVYDLILMDVQMPEMDGYEATRRIRAFERERREKVASSFLRTTQEALPKEVPIIAMTANVFREDVEKCLEAGMNDHVGKPLDFEEVLSKLRVYLTPP
jgi:signal transduction histidine kinase/CheY-like chemotaxis protein